MYDTLLSDTLCPNGLTESDTSPGVWLNNKPMDLSVCVSEDRGGELLNCQLQENGQFPDESEKIKGTQIHSVGVLPSTNRRYTGNSV